jgi:ribosomal protein S18 acetylase RimI-like enzyme
MISVREAKPHDHSFIVQAQVSMAFETEGLTLFEGVVERGVQAVLDDPAKGKYYLAVDSSTDQPLACLLTIPEWSDWRNGTVLWIHSLYVSPSARKTGIFKILYDHLKKKVETSPDLRGIRLYVDKRNQRAQDAYERVGMSKEHYEMYEWLKA